MRIDVEYACAYCLGSNPGASSYAYSLGSKPSFSSAPRFSIISLPFSPPAPLTYARLLRVATRRGDAADGVRHVRRPPQRPHGDWPRAASRCAHAFVWHAVRGARPGPLAEGEEAATRSEL